MSSVQSVRKKPGIISRFNFDKKSKPKTIHKSTKRGAVELSPEERARIRLQLKAYLIAQKVKAGKRRTAEVKALQEFLDYLRSEE